MVIGQLHELNIWLQFQRLEIWSSVVLPRSRLSLRSLGQAALFQCALTRRGLVDHFLGIEFSILRKPEKGCHKFEMTWQYTINYYCSVYLDVWVAVSALQMEQMQLSYPGSSSVSFTLMGRHLPVFLAGSFSAPPGCVREWSRHLLCWKTVFFLSCFFPFKAKAIPFNVLSAECALSWQWLNAVEVALRMHMFARVEKGQEERDRESTPQIS